MDRFIRSQNVERYLRLLERVTEPPDRQKIVDLLAEERKSKKTRAIRFDRLGVAVYLRTNGDLRKHSLVGACCPLLMPRNNLALLR